MAQKRVQGNIKIGCVYECNFGLFKKKGSNTTTTVSEEADSNDLNYRIPVEMIKLRPIVVIGKHKGQYIVVPISSKYEYAKKPHKIPENRGFHVPIKNFIETHHYKKDIKVWAKSNLVTTVDGGRLSDIFDRNTNKDIDPFKIDDDTLLKIREGVLISIGLSV